MNHKYFPAVITQSTAHGAEAVLGMELKSLLKGNLFFEEALRGASDDKYVANVNEPRMMIYRESFLRAIAAWPKNITLELSITALPNLQYRAQGRVLISLFLRVQDKNEVTARQEALSKYLSLQALLNSCVSEAEFMPITDRNELEFHLAPFAPAQAIAVHRRSEKIQVSDAIEKKTVTGLTPGNHPQKTVPQNTYVKYVYPWRPSFDDWSSLMHVLMGQLDPLRLLIRLRPAKMAGASRNKIEDYIRTCELYLHPGKAYQLSLIRQATIVRNALSNQLTELSDSAFDVGVFLFSEHTIDSTLGNMLGHAITSKALTGNEDSSLYGGFATSAINVKKATDSRFFPEKTPFTLTEASCAFRLPSPPTKEILGLPIRRSRTNLALMPELDNRNGNGIDLCRNIHNGLTQPVNLPADDRMRHMFIIGQTGTGKSTMMESMILQDMRAGHGLALIDPHGEMVDSILGKIPPERIDDVIVFDFLDRKRPLGFNLLQWQTEEERDFVIDEIYATLDRIYSMKDTGGPIFETHLRGMLRLLMGSKRADEYKPTILEFRDCYLQPNFRKWLVARIDDRVTEDFVKEIERAGGDTHINNISQYVTSKFSRFVHDTTLMNIIGQEEAAFNFDEIMAQGKIFLVKVGKGRFGPSVSALLANQLVSRFKRAAMKRGEMQPEQRRDFYLYVDECHNLPASNFTELLSEARKYRMGLVLATQYATQLHGGGHDDNLLAAILGNVGCMAMFRLGQEDAQLLATSLFPHFNMMDIIGLPNWQGYCRLQIRNQAVAPFSFESMLDKTPFDPKVARQARELSRQIYGCDVETIKKKIIKRQNIWKKEDENNEDATD